MDTGRRTGPQLVLFQCLTLGFSARASKGVRLAPAVVRESWKIHVPPLVPVSAVVESGPRHQQSKVLTSGALGVCPGLLYLIW
ncbi:hypothetical protein Taro_007352 [Colocasia esculenta]|uniref:Uncharacterized protein n=1 Tax=Colocasia esculenta TaxID=4460 RepID=A0A843TYQ1_COLES|nr:hypothetical protein [Colocasia esculenta]